MTVEWMSKNEIVKELEGILKQLNDIGYGNVSHVFENTFDRSYLFLDAWDALRDLKMFIEGFDEK